MVWPAWHNRIVKLTGTGGNRARVGASPMSKEIG
jgi:hypothetical protein